MLFFRLGAVANPLLRHYDSNAQQAAVPAHYGTEATLVKSKISYYSGICIVVCTDSYRVWPAAFHADLQRGRDPHSYEIGKFHLDSKKMRC
jgi:hypothetical protein